MGLAILGVLVLCFIALAVLSAKTWQIWHVVLVVALFLATCCFAGFAAATLKTQKRWRTQYKDLTADLEQQQKEQTRLQQGLSMGDAEPSLSQLRADLLRTLVDRGRVWRNLRRVADTAEGAITLDATNWGDDACFKVGSQVDEFEDAPIDPIPAEGEAAATAGNRPLGLQSNAIVFAFKATPIAALPKPIQQLLYGDSSLPERDTKGFCKIPTFYLGEFKVTSDPQAEPTSLTLTPTLPLSQAQVEELNDPNTTWVLYETLPVDSHQSLNGLTREQLQAWLPPMTEDPEAYAAIIDEYVRDQTQASDMDPPERKWMKVKFTEAKTDIDVDVNEPISLPDAPYDPSGRANSDDLRQLAKSEFAKGDVVELDFATAQEFINSGIAEPVEPIYVRRLRDYERVFREHASQLDTADRQVVIAEADLAKLKASLTNLGNQIAFATAQRQQLREDRDGFNMELAVITEYQQALEKEWKSVLSDLSRLYRTNKQQVGL